MALLQGAGREIAATGSGGGMGSRLISLHEVALPSRRASGSTRFSRDVAALAARVPWPQGSQILIAGDDAYGVAVSLFGILHAGCCVVFPANLQMGHLTELAARTDGVVATDATISLAHSVPALSGGNVEASKPLDSLNPNIAGVILHTSGSTGMPVPVPKLLRQLDSEVTALEQTFGTAMGQAVMATVPPYHIYGLLFRVLWPLAARRDFSAPTIAYPEEVVSFAARRPGTALVSSPAFLRRALPVLDLNALKGSLGPVFSSGGPLSPEVAAAYNAQLRHPIAEVYGSTETGGIAYRSVTASEVRPPWRPLPGVEIRTDPDDGTLWVRSPFQGSCDWCTTEDVIVPRGNGFEIRGRRDRILKLQEQRVSLVEVETRLSDCDAVEEVRVIPVETGASARASLAAVVRPSADGWASLVRSGKRALVDELAAILRLHLNSSAVPRRWRFVKELPMDERGKTTEVALRALFELDAGRNVAPDIISEKHEGSELRLHLRIPGSLFYFRGHFASVPVLPGVVQIDWALHFAESRLGIKPNICRVEALKFFDILSNDREVFLTISWEKPSSRFSFAYSFGQAKYSSGRIVLAEEP